VDVLIGKPDTEEKDGKIEGLLEQLRLRQLSIEQLETYERQKAASLKQRELNEAIAQTEMQTSLTNARVKAQIAESEGEAELARARKQGEKTVVLSEAELAKARRQAEQTLVLAEADSKQAVLHGRGEAQRILQVGLSEASVLMRKISSFGDPRVYAATQLGRELAKSSQPLVPERVFLVGGSGGETLTRSVSEGGGDANGHVSGQGAGLSSLGTTGVVGLLLNMLLADKTAFANADGPEAAELKALASRMSHEALTNLEAKPACEPAAEKVAKVS
jgi:hypothetical protein